MAINEEARQQLYRALEEALGHEPATTLMDRLTFDERFEARFSAIDARFERLAGEMAKEFGLVHEQFGEVHLRIAEWGRTLVLANVATMVAAVSLAFAASRL